MTTPTAPPVSRRRFLKSASVLAAPYIGWKTTSNGQSPNESFRYACFGSNGRAWGNITSMAGVPNTRLVAVAEIDRSRIDKVSRGFPEAKVYFDWRELLDKEADNLDGILVSTPDHQHAPITMAGMQLGKHAYSEKPMTRTLHEARVIREFAEANSLVTQMGIQVSSSSGNRTAADLLQKKVIGKIKEVHSMNPKSWGSMSTLLDREDPVPEGLDWDQWIGVGRMRPYIAREFHPGQWRKRIGYGTGTLGDMGCHIYHPWFAGLGMPVTLTVTSHGAGPVDAHSWPLNAKVHHRMKGNEFTGGDFDFTWYDGNQFPGKHVIDATGGETTSTDAEGKSKVQNQVPRSGSVVIGETGALVIPHGGGGVKIYRDGELSDEAIEEVPSDNHHHNWVGAIRGEHSEKPRANFSYAGPMTEAVLLGTVAMRIPGQELTWNDEEGRFHTDEIANAMVHDTYRKGWEVEGI